MTSSSLAPIVEGDLTLRMLEREDLPTTLAWRNHPDSRPWFHMSEALREEDHLAWFEAYLGRADDHVFIVERAGVPVAQVSLYDVEGGTAEFGRLVVDPAVRGTGLSRGVIGLCLRVADDVLDLREVHLEVLPDNARAITGYERAGFVTDGTRTGRHDSLIMRRSRA
jgi:RimJ/RimL family protein N-acetyltransferase